MVTAANWTCWDRQGKLRPVTAFEPHTMRHVAASLWIEQDLPPKKVQELLGHSTLQLTMDLYGAAATTPTTRSPRQASS